TPGSSAEYRCELRPTGKWTPRADGQLYLVLDTPGRSLVRIHAANWAGDVTKGKESQLEGCIALGVGRGIGVPPDHPETQPMIVSSRVALERFMQATQGLPITLAITRG
ncbi:MAG TPA: DUF5675 family protein, partial [Solirubrobacteraceae bacterium]|nr:DUF5675 family protein [Solirubrobacteraceae bacterium]